MSFLGSVVLVTGASRGLGEVTARQFAAAGAEVILTARSEQQGLAIADSIKASGGKATFFSHDVTSASAWEQLAAQIAEEHGQLNTLVNNAGVHIAKSLLDSSEDDFDFLINTNLKGIFLGCKACVPLMRAAIEAGGRGQIINVSSVAGLVGVPNQSIYNMSKGGMQMFSKSLALELARFQIRVNCVNPGMIETEMGDDLVDMLVQQGIFATTGEVERYLKKQIPLRRFAKSEEVAKSILFLASDAADYITGSEIVLDGGLTAG